jgi:hypothetical protein
VAGVAVVIADGIYFVETRSGQPSVALAVAPLFIGATLFLVAWAALSIADWTYRSEKYYREAEHVAASRARAYILAGRRTRGEIADDTPLANDTPLLERTSHRLTEADISTASASPPRPGTPPEPASAPTVGLVTPAH